MVDNGSNVPVWRYGDKGIAVWFAFNRPNKVCAGSKGVCAWPFVIYNNILGVSTGDFRATQI